MALFDDLLKGEAAKGVALGLGVAVVAPLAVIALTGVARPIARATIKAGIIVYEKGRETVAEFGEVMEDLVAEAQAEIAEGQTANGAQGGGAESEGSPEAPAPTPPAQG